MGTSFAQEARAVNSLKQRKRFSVVIGNPPYAVTSSNSNLFIDSLMMDYKKILQGERSLVALADDYLKFIRLSQELINRSGVGIWGMITNHSYIKGVIHRGVRKTLLRDYSKLFVLDLHGDSNIGERISGETINENVFEIQQGVALTVGVFHPQNSKTNLIHHGDSWGTRIEKYHDLSLGTIFSRKWNDIYPTEPNFFFVTFDKANYDEYQMYPALNELMFTGSCGVKTHRDNLVIDFEKDVLTMRMRDVASNDSINELRARYDIKDTRHWSLADAKKKIDVTTVDNCVFPILYRPFDIRWIYYNPKIIEKGDSKYPTLRHMLHPNLALLTCRIQATGTFNAVFVSQHIAEMKTAESSRSSTVFPLFVSHESEANGDGVDTFERQPNFHPSFLRVLAEKLGTTQIGVYGLPRGLNAEVVFYYVYAMLHSPVYRTRYSDFLRTDFPRLPLTARLQLFHAIAKLGHELVSIHLMESSYLSNIITKIKGDLESYFVTKVSFSDKTVWIDKDRTTGFQGVPEAVWQFHIGGYQVCHKWLKDRKGRTLSEDDINHYQKIVVAINETIRIMREIDQVIEEYGGWPGVFVGKH